MTALSILYQFREKRPGLVPQKKVDHRRRVHRRCRGQFRVQCGGQCRAKTCGGFLDEAYDEVYIVYSEFFGMGRQVPTLKQLLPIPPIETAEDRRRR